MVSGCAPPVIGARGCLPHGGQQVSVVFRKECKVRLWPIKKLKNRMSTMMLLSPERARALLTR
ncbi:hypothetical protein P1113_gp41 [Propionibacterium phage PaP11-13]|nr:hypothetical protein P1113_gp41 [Propionibacterium phage PaP11-13]